MSFYFLSWFAGGELQEAREALARADSSSSDSEDENNSKKKKDQDKPTEEVWIESLYKSRQKSSSNQNLEESPLCTIF